MAVAAVTIERPLHEYDDMAFALMCFERKLPRELRWRAGLTQQALADRLGLPRIIIHTWEHGTMPRLRDMDTLARYGRELRRLAQETGFVIS